MAKVTNAYGVDQGQKTPTTAIISRRQKKLTTHGIKIVFQSSTN